MRLRTLLGAAMAALALLVLGASAALLVLANAGRDVAAYIILSVRSVEVAQQLRLDVARLRSGGPDAVVNADIDRNLQLAAEFIQSDEETKVVQELRAAVKSMREAEAAHSDANFLKAALEADRTAEVLVAVNVRQAHEAEREVQISARRGEIWAGVIAGGLALGLLIIVVWTRTRVLKPLRQLRNRIQSFALGGPNRPASSEAPLEVQEVALTFDIMAKAVELRHRERVELLAQVAASIAVPLDRIAQVVDGLDPTRSSEVPPLARELVRLRRVLDEYIDAAQIEEGILKFDQGRVDLVSVITEAVGLFRSLSPAHLVSLTLARDHAYVQGDPRRLAQVVNNLLFIAARHGPLGGPIRVSVHEEGETTTLAVNVAPTVSGSFERLFTTLRGLENDFLGAPGSGFTIHTTRRVLEAHGGSLEVERLPNAMVKFVVRLTRSREEDSREIGFETVPSGTRPA